MSGSETDDRDVLWGISPDPFPFHSPLKEMQVSLLHSLLFEINVHVISFTTLRMIAINK